MNWPRVFDPSPTGAPRQINRNEEEPVIPNPVKRAVANALIKVGVVVAVAAAVKVADQLQQATGRKWI